MDNKSNTSSSMHLRQRQLTVSGIVLVGVASRPKEVILSDFSNCLTVSGILCPV